MFDRNDTHGTKTGRRELLKAGAMGFLWTVLGGPSAASGGTTDTGDRPNVVLYLSDDHGWRDAGFCGNPDVKTPNLDRLAAQGISFSQAFTASPICGPTRAQFYTGLFPVRSRAYFNHPRHYVREGTVTVPSALRKLGYRVGIIGKVDAGPVEAYPFELLEDRNDVREFVTRDVSQPFCLVEGNGKPHWPWGAPHEYDPDSLTVPPHMVDTPETRAALAAYYGKVTSLDADIGDCMDMLDELDLADETLFMWSSEQGAEFPMGKYTLYDNGMKVAFIARWPGRIRAGAVSDAIIQHVDVLPTIVAAAGGEPPKDLDGRSFLSVLLGRSDAHGEAAYGCLPETRAVRTARYKLIRNLTAEEPKTMTYSPLRKNPMGRHMDHVRSWVEVAETDRHAAERLAWFEQRSTEELYDVQNDPCELNNLAEDPAHAAILSQLRSRLDEWVDSQGDKGLETMAEIRTWQTQQHRAGKCYLGRTNVPDYQVVCPGQR